MTLLRRLTAAFAVVALVLAASVAFALRDRPARDAHGERREAAGVAGVVEYFAAGSGPAVVLCASFARSASDFNELAIALGEAGYRTLAVNARGIEGSALGTLSVTYHDLAADVAAVLDAERIRGPALLLGHAYGNRVIRTFASDHPQRARAVVLLAAGGEAPAPPDVGEALQTAVFGWSEAGREEAIAYAFFADGNAVPPHWLDGWYPRAALQQGAAVAATADGWSDAGGAPLLVLQPGADRAAPPERGRDLAARFPERVRYRVIEGAGHAALPERPDQIALEVIGFFDEIVARFRP